MIAKKNRRGAARNVVAIPEVSLPRNGEVIDHPGLKQTLAAAGMVICLECGQSHKSLSRHLSAVHNMTAGQYRAQYGADARINPPGVKPGRKPGAAGAPAVPESDKPDNLLARASGIGLLELDRFARDGFTHLDKIIQGALFGQTDEARLTFAIAYEFSRRCLKKPAQAEALPRWEEANVQAGTNPYYRPLKYLTIDVLSSDLTSTATQTNSVGGIGDSSLFGGAIFLRICSGISAIKAGFGLSFSHCNVMLSAG